MALTLEQKIAQKEAELARLKTAQRKLEVGQKIIVGGLIIKAAQTQPEVKKWLIANLKKITREADIKRVQPLIESLNTHTKNN